MRHQSFSWDNLSGKEACKSMITKGVAFQFPPSDIARIRKEFRLLIDKLSELYGRVVGSVKVSN